MARAAQISVRSAGLAALESECHMVEAVFGVVDVAVARQLESPLEV
ncbi:hypothetical protein OG563_42270 [Nocardia vinacea]|uniref:Uncharacterized protein n=1 Tax=Nocardia vinacea TaxID=96468 RepID=A0ABZ1YUM9_9NOCA|nr:hypothetical protein [Nocardia vinacea]